MKYEDLSNEIKSVLDSLRGNIGNSEFGYRMQALFAHVLAHMGHKILEVNQKGHPDVKSVCSNITCRHQIKTISHSYAGATLLIDESDVEGILPTSRLEKGFYVVLDCGFPISWLVINACKIGNYRNMNINIETLWALADKNKSLECNEIFRELIIKYRDRISRLTYSILCHRILNDDPL